MTRNVMPARVSLKETLDAATRECAPDDLACVFERDWANEVLADRNHEIVALVLDMGEALHCEGYDHYTNLPEGRPFNYPEEPMCDNCALLARLDRIGKEQT